ncbi:VWA domain-containing protein [Jannaschia sp. 2305UL9-9]|uniref:VWA domain-containing protein n=1 Tax=Jannaschia sp. 2305UL9-9 TaxID=3121638 RepID=UPI003527189B
MTARDIVFVIDTTGSMGGPFNAINAARADLLDLLFGVDTTEDVRVAIVGYNDPNVTTLLEFTDQEDIGARRGAAAEGLDRLTATGGGDFPEYTYTGLLRALDGTVGTWRADVDRDIILIGDATAKDASLRDEVLTLAADVDPGDGVVPVSVSTIAVGGNSSTIAEFEGIAAATGGAAQAPSNSGIGAAIANLFGESVTYDLSTDAPDEGLSEGAAGDETEVTITVTRDTTEGAASFQLSTAGDADAQDFSTPLSGAFSDGEATATVVLTVTGDDILEADETIRLTLEATTGFPSYTTREVVLTILNDDDAQQIGTDMTDVLNGTDFNDVLEGRGGRDILEGGRGNDRIAGEAGDDVLSGGRGYDTLNGGDGDDVITGGDDFADVRDVIYGAGGKDVIDGGYGNDLIYGGDDGDVIMGGFGADLLLGQNGDDIVTGGAGGDTLRGGSGDDFLNGGFGNDNLRGGDGADRFYHDGTVGHGADWIADYDAAEGDELLFGQAGATVDDFVISYAATAPNGGAPGEDDVEEAYVTYVPSGEVVFVLVDGADLDRIDMRIAGGEAFDLLA